MLEDFIKGCVDDIVCVSYKMKFLWNVVNWVFYGMSVYGVYLDFFCNSFCNILIFWVICNNVKKLVFI